jgi:hypothetical protein
MLLAFLVFILGMGHLWAHPLEPTHSYEERLAQVRELGIEAPRVVLPFGGSHRRSGLWAGILIQTEWQLRTGRDEFEMWSILNHSLTTLPFNIYQSFKSDSESACKSFKEIQDVCEAWVKFYKAEALNQRSQKLMWKAHTLSLKSSLEHFYDLFVRFEREWPLETRYMLNWIQIIHIVERLNVPSHDFVARPISRYQARCAPLDDRDCMDELTRFNRFVAMTLANKPMTTARLIKLLSR